MQCLLRLWKPVKRDHLNVHVQDVDDGTVKVDLVREAVLNELSNPTSIAEDLEGLYVLVGLTEIGSVTNRVKLLGFDRRAVQSRPDGLLMPRRQEQSRLESDLFLYAAAVVVSAIENRGAVSAYVGVESHYLILSAVIQK